MAKLQTFHELEERLGHTFENATLCQRALTHSSARGGDHSVKDNERLEFLGDRVLALVVVDALLKAFPNDSEGELARRTNRLVRRETCTDVARSLDLGQFIILADSEAASGGRRKATILADAMEAVLAAIFLDAGYSAARDVILKLWKNRLNYDGGVNADAKTALQEWAQGNDYPLPQYREVERTGPDHAPKFVAEVLVGDDIRARGEGPSKRIAEQAAAAAALASQCQTGTQTNG